MNCDDARRRLLADDRPDRPSDASVCGHLADCPPCRAYGRRLTLIERRIPHLAVPPSSAKAAFVRRFLRTQGPVVRRLPLPLPTPAKERGLRKLSLAVAIAAVLAVFTLALWSGPHFRQPPPQTEPSWIVEIHKERDRIAALPSARERVEQLTALAADLRARARTLTRKGDADGLTRMAREYGDLMSDDLRRHAHDLPTDQRPAALAGLVKELGDAESEFQRSAGDRPGSPSAAPLLALARAARNGGRDVQALLRAA